MKAIKYRLGYTFKANRSSCLIYIIPRLLSLTVESVRFVRAVRKRTKKKVDCAATVKMFKREVALGGKDDTWCQGNFKIKAQQIYCLTLSSARFLPRCSSAHLPIIYFMPVICKMCKWLLDLLYQPKNDNNPLGGWWILIIAETFDQWTKKKTPCTLLVSDHMREVCVFEMSRVPAFYLFIFYLCFNDLPG